MYSPHTLFTRFSCRKINAFSLLFCLPSFFLSSPLFPSFSLLSSTPRFRGPLPSVPPPSPAGVWLGGGPHLYVLKLFARHLAFQTKVRNFIGIFLPTQKYRRQSERQKTLLYLSFFVISAASPTSHDKKLSAFSFCDLAKRLKIIILLSEKFRATSVISLPILFDYQNWKLITELSHSHRELSSFSLHFYAFVERYQKILELVSNLLDKLTPS